VRRRHAFPLMCFHLEKACFLSRHVPHASLLAFRVLIFFFLPALSLLFFGEFFLPGRTFFFGSRHHSPPSAIPSLRRLIRRRTKGRPCGVFCLSSSPFSSLRRDVFCSQQSASSPFSHLFLTDPGRGHESLTTTPWRPLHREVSPKSPTLVTLDWRFSQYLDYTSSLGYFLTLVTHFHVYEGI